MELVEPIREKHQLENMKLQLKQRDLRGWLMFVIGINSGLRISDLLSLTVDDVKGKDRIRIREMKTDKMKNFPLSDTVRKAVDEYLKKTNIKGGYLFPSRKRDLEGNKKSITRRQAYNILTEGAQKAGIIKDGVRFGTHSLRKSFGYWAYSKGCSIEIIQKLLNHSSSAVSLRYIGITQKELDDVYLNLNL